MLDADRLHQIKSVLNKVFGRQFIIDGQLASHMLPESAMSSVSVNYRWNHFAYFLNKVWVVNV